MNNRLWFKKTVAWSLIAAIANPAAIAPAFARDTDIFLSVSAGSNTGEPNILIILDTSDSMNIPEAWREYPGAYDSHIEYLWNDPTFISQIGCSVANCATGSDQFTAATKNQSQPPDYTVGFLPQGYFAGADAAARGAFKQAALNYANAEDPLDAAISGAVDARNIWRNYSAGGITYLNNGTLTTAVAPNGINTDSSWIYWLPAATADTDPRLRAPAFNRWRGDQSNIGGVRGGINYGTASTNFSGNNKCTSSLNQLLPSTVYHPLPNSRNNGVWTNQIWQRWEPYLNLTSVNGTSGVPAYPATLSTTTTANGGAATATSGASVSYRNDFLGNTITPPVGTTVPPSLHPAAGAPKVDSAPITSTLNPAYFTSSTPGSQGQPIKTIKGPIPAAGWVSGDSYSAWGPLKGDLGGYNYQSVINSFNSTALGQAGLTLLLQTYGFNSSPNRCFGDTVVPTAANAANCAYLGNAVATGTPGYYDYRARDLALTTTVVSGGTTVTRVCGWNTTGPNNSNVATPNLGVTTNDGPDAGGVTRVWRNTANNFCVTNTTASTPPLGTPGGDYSAAPACAPSNSGQTFSTGSVTYGGTCAWTGRTSSVFEGDPTVYYHGGTCGGATTCTATGTGTCVTPHCVISGTTTGSVHGTPLTDYRTDNITNGCNRRSSSSTSQTCNVRNGGVCVTGNYAPGCSNQTAVIGAATTSTTKNYGTFNLAATTANFAHDCKADEGGAGPWMTNQQRNFGIAWNGTSAADNTNRAAAYTSTSTNQITSGAVDMYSVNYLNWRFGPKANGNPIGRKTRLQIAKDALTALITNTDGVRFGLQVFNKQPSSDPGNVGSEGGNIAFAVSRMGNDPTDLPAYNNRAALQAKINGLLANAATPLTEALYEAYLYYAGRAPQFGILSTPALGGGTVSAGYDPTALCTTTNASIGCPVAGATAAAPRYKSPMMNNPDAGPPSATLLGPAVCQKNYVIMITDGGPDRDISANNLIKNLQWTSGADVIAAKTNIDNTQPDTTSTWGYQFETGGLPYGPVNAADLTTDGGYVWLDELAYFMAKADVSPLAPNTAAEAGVLTDPLLAQRQSVITYTVGFAGGNAPVLQNTALKGGGTYYVADDTAALSAALTAALVAIREWNPTVASPSVPISALNRAENGTDVYLSFFKPDPSQTWDGTVKRYRLGTSEAECGTGITLCLTSKVAASSGYLNIEKVETLPDGTTNIIVDDTAESYWTPTPDGGKPNQGGTGQQVIGNTPGFTPDNRKVFTWISNVSTSADTTTTNNLVTEANTYTSTNTSGLITKALLGLANSAATDTAALNAIRYIRGANLGDANCTDGSPATVCSWRAWVHADVQHSRPTIVTYDPIAIPDTQVPALQQPATRAKVQYVYYLSNDGLLHAVDADTGKEQWVFLVEEALPQITALQADSSGAQLNLADGSPIVWISDANGDGAIDTSTDKVYLYFGLRRGGRAYYALDVTQRDAPAMLWKISNTTTCGPKGTSCTTDATYSELGQTWSTPTVGNIRKLGAGVPAVVFGGGFDPNQDNFKVTSADTMGRALFIVDGRDGKRVSSFGTGQAHSLSMNYSVPSDPAAINSDLDAQGFLDRVYIGDMGGYLWRFDINNNDPTLWTGKLLANLSSDTPLTVDRRKIMFPPAVVKQNFGVAGRFDAVYVGTGDREHPTKTQATTPATPNDKIFMIKDPDWDVTQPVSATTWTFADLIQLPNNSATGITASALLTAGGWYRDLDADCTPAGTPPRISCGEKVTSAPTVFFNKLRFGTYTPTAQSNACAPAGEGRLNEIDALTGAFIPLNATSSGTSKDRYYSTFLARGYVSTGQLIVVGKNIYHITVADARLQSILVGTIGAATKIYWYMEPEL